MHINRLGNKYGSHVDVCVRIRNSCCAYKREVCCGTQTIFFGGKWGMTWEWLNRTEQPDWILVKTKSIKFVLFFFPLWEYFRDIITILTNDWSPNHNTIDRIQYILGFCNYFFSHTLIYDHLLIALACLTNERGLTYTLFVTSLDLATALFRIHLCALQWGGRRDGHTTKTINNLLVDWCLGKKM